MTLGDRIIHRLLRLQFSGLAYASEIIDNLPGTAQEAAGWLPERAEFKDKW